MARVLLENVSKTYDGSVMAVDGMNLEVDDGELMVVVGPSGCGKTTLLRMIAGLEGATQGKIVIGEQAVNDISPKDRNIAMVFQNYALYPHMTVFQNMAFGMKLRKYPRNEIHKRVQKTAEMLGIEGLLERKPKALSGGQRQRVALGRAIVRNPQVFLFDEPLSNLDAKLRVTTRTELKALHHRLKTTSIYVTHDQAEAMTLGDRICVMHKGVPQQTASPMEVYNRPANRFVAGFLGTPPMNFFEGKIKTSGSQFCFDFNKCSIQLPERLNDVISKYKDQTLLMGIRPEDFMCQPSDQDSSLAISATVQVVEPLGDKQEVHLQDNGGQKFIACFSPHITFKIDEQMEVYVKIEKIHLFELDENGKNISF